jgi:hypothetical protein
LLQGRTPNVIPDTPSVAQLAVIINQVTAPAFLLGAVAAFVAILVSRLNRIIDRSQVLNAIGDDDASRLHLREDVPRLRRRAVHLNRAILLATVSAIATSLLVIVAFVSAFLKVQHEYGVAMLFIIALGFFTASLWELTRELRIALHELDYYQ